jgi:hypothetical protein
LERGLRAAGLRGDVADRLVAAGGGEAVRSDTSEGSPLRMLVDAGVDLTVLDHHLGQLGDEGLSVNESRRRLGHWIDVHGRRCAAVLARRQPPELAKSALAGIDPPPALAMFIDPPVVQLLEPVRSVLKGAGFTVDVDELAADPLHALAHLGGFSTVTELDDEVARLYDAHEQARFLRERASAWTRELRILGVLAGTRTGDLRSNIRAVDESVAADLPVMAARPSELRVAVGVLFGSYPAFADAVAGEISDALAAPPPNRDGLLALARRHGLPVDHLDIVRRALEAPRREQARNVKRRAEQLTEHHIEPVVPAGMSAPARKSSPKPEGAKKVASVKVSAGQDRRKKELGDEGEEWALAAAISKLLALERDSFDAAIDDVIALLRGTGGLPGFAGAPVDTALSYADRARPPVLDDEELIEELTGLLHVSRHSDAFGFDLIGWLPPAVGTEPMAMCLEVKSSSDRGFHLSQGEWFLAQTLHDAGEGDRYAILVVRRSPRGGPPAGMDLLVDPVELVDSGRLRRDVDGYKLGYQADG